MRDDPIRAAARHHQRVAQRHGAVCDWCHVHLITPVPWLARQVTPFGPALHDKYYLARIRAGEPLPAIKLQNWANIVTLRDGNHRLGAAIELGLAEIAAEWRLQSGEAEEWLEARLLEGFRRC